MGVKSLFLTNHTKESRQDLNLLTITLPRLIPTSSALCSWVRPLQKDGGQGLQKDGRQARRFKRIILMFRLSLWHALISEIQVFTVCCITPNLCARAASVHLHSGSNPNWVKLNWVVISYWLMVIGFLVSIGKVLFQHACPPSLSLRRVSEFRNSEAGGDRIIKIEMISCQITNNV